VTTKGQVDNKNDWMNLLRFGSSHGHTDLSNMALRIKYYGVNLLKQDFLQSSRTPEQPNMLRGQYVLLVIVEDGSAVPNSYSHISG
jgi:hypothetical protein